MVTIEEQNKAAVVQFIKALNKGAGEDLATFYHADVEQTEFPNAITSTVTVRSLEDLRKASEKGKMVIEKQFFDISRMFASGDTVIMEAVWTGVLKVPVGKIPVGGSMKAYFAQVFEFKNGKIYRQRNYDCFEPIH